jgi:hypothetical protein
MPAPRLSAFLLLATPVNAFVGDAIRRLPFGRLAFGCCMGSACDEQGERDARAGDGRGQGGDGSARADGPASAEAAAARPARPFCSADPSALIRPRSASGWPAGLGWSTFPDGGFAIG